jgi:hypothetical protein
LQNGRITGLKRIDRRLIGTWKSDASPYTVLGADDSSVALSLIDPALDRQSIVHIHFEGQRYWISLGGFIREYFRRVQARGVR